jgi:N-acyl-D-amino-acid deacylase
VGEIICQLVELDYGAQHVHHHGGSEEGLETIMAYENHIACSDALYVGDRPHPRCYGSYPRYLGLHVREHAVIPLEECVRQMTSSPAKMLGLLDRGQLVTGKKADVVVFDDTSIVDRATWEHPTRQAEGLSTVIVNGSIVREGGNSTGATPGRALRRLDG